MTKITINADCGDAPKTLLRDLNIAFARADVEAILALMSDDVVWRMVGAGVSEGKDAVRQTLEAMADVVASELVIDSIITDEIGGAVSGEIRLEGGRAYAFCDVVQFTSAGDKIKSMTSYAIDISKDD